MSATPRAKAVIKNAQEIAATLALAMEAGAAGSGMAAAFATDEQTKEEAEKAAAVLAFSGLLLGGGAVETLKKKGGVKKKTCSCGAKFETTTDRSVGPCCMQKGASKAAAAPVAQAYVVTWHVNDHAEGKVFRSKADALKKFRDMEGGQWATVLYDEGLKEVSRYGCMCAADWAMLKKWARDHMPKGR
jgi:hypothetical protein